MASYTDKVLDLYSLAKWTCSKLGKYKESFTNTGTPTE